MLLNDIADRLDREDLGKVPDTIKVGIRPEKPDQVILVESMPGAPSVRVRGKRTPLTDRPKFAVLCRGAQGDYERPQALAQRAYEVLDCIRNEYLNDTFYLSIRADGPPFFVRQDENQRRIHSCVFTVEKEHENA